MQLSKHFTLEEFTFSETATRNHLDNDPPSLMYGTLKKTAEGMELVRSHLGDLPIRITSGYRALAVNRAVGSSDTSQHVKGEAVDFKCPAYGDPRAIVTDLAKSGIPFDQLILEFDSWVHISFSGIARRQVLIIDKNGTRPFK